MALLNDQNETCPDGCGLSLPSYSPITQHVKHPATNPTRDEIVARFLSLLNQSSSEQRLDIITTMFAYVGDLNLRALADEYGLIDMERPE